MRSAEHRDPLPCPGPPPPPNRAPGPPPCARDPSPPVPRDPPLCPGPPLPDPRSPSRSGSRAPAPPGSALFLGEVKALNAFNYDHRVYTQEIGQPGFTGDRRPSPRRSGTAGAQVRHPRGFEERYPTSRPGVLEWAPTARLRVCWVLAGSFSDCGSWRKGHASAHAGCHGGSPTTHSVPSCPTTDEAKAMTRRRALGRGATRRVGVRPMQVVLLRSRWYETFTPLSLPFEH